MTTKDKFNVALIGNPNTGKSTLFNQLTGIKQKVGNYPGVTVEKREGKMLLGGKSINIVDLPGSYSLSATSADEQIVIDYLVGNLPQIDKPNLVICVIDSTNITRNLFLASQIADANYPLILALNMSDEAKARGISIDHQELSRRLKVPVIPIVSTKRKGLIELKREIKESLDNPQTMTRVDWPKDIDNAIATLKKEFLGSLPENITKAELQHLLFNYNGTSSKKRATSEEQIEKILNRLRSGLEKKLKMDFTQIESDLRYEWLDKITHGVLKEKEPGKKHFSDKLDTLLTHRAFGLLIFFGVMYLVFQSIYTFAGPFMDFIDNSFASLGEITGEQFESLPILQSLIVDGIIAGVGGIVIFLPQILILFLFIAILEDSGYMARAAFLMDKVFGWCGLNGKSFVPFLSSYACAIPGVMATRTIEDQKLRLITILTAPLMSCSARLPVYVLLIAAFVEPNWGPIWAGLALFAMHFLGLLVAITVAYVLSKLLSKRTPSPFILEMPPYRLPQLRNVFWRMCDRGKHFLIQAGTIILAMSIVIWALCYFPHSSSVAEGETKDFLATLALEKSITESQAKLLLEDPNLNDQLEKNIAAAYMEQSYMGRIGKAVQPIFAPAGFDWKVTVGVLASFPAREVIISTLGIIYRLGGDVDEESSELISSMKNSKWPDGTPVITPVVAIGIMVFFALCMQCGATVAVIARESSWKWASFAFCYMTGLAWLGAVIVYQVGNMVCGAGG